VGTPKEADGATVVTTDAGEAVDGACSASDAPVPVVGKSDGDACTAAGEAATTPVAATAVAATPAAATPVEAAAGTTTPGMTSATKDAPAPIPAATCASASACPATAALEG
jgi:cell division septation protein DedD